MHASPPRQTIAFCRMQLRATCAISICEALPLPLSYTELRRMRALQLLTRDIVVAENFYLHDCIGTIYEGALKQSLAPSLMLSKDVGNFGLAGKISNERDAAPPKQETRPSGSTRSASITSCCGFCIKDAWLSACTVLPRNCHSMLTMCLTNTCLAMHANIPYILQQKLRFLSMTCVYDKIQYFVWYRVN